MADLDFEAFDELMQKEKKGELGDLQANGIHGSKDINPEGTKKANGKDSRRDDDAKKRKTLATNTQCSKSFLMRFKNAFISILL